MAYFRSIIGLFGAVFLFVTLLMVNVLQTLSLLVLPFSRHLFRRFNRFCAQFWWGMCVVFMEKVQRIKVTFSGDKIPTDENAILIANHQGMSDIPFLLAHAWHHNRLGDLKWFVKDILKYVPGMGWGMWFLDCIFLKRNWTEDKASIESTFEKVRSDKVPIWLISFLEGTRKTPSKLQSSQNYAKQNKLQPLNYLLIPRTKGFVASIKGLGSHIQAVYDFTLAYEGNEVPSLPKLFSGNIKPVHIYVRRFLVSTLPKDDQALTQWVFELFQEKDQILSGFYKNHSFLDSPQKSLLMASLKEPGVSPS